MPQVTTSVDFRYDSLGRTLEESQVYAGGTARNVTNSKFGSYPATEFTFPNNRQTTNVYDTLYRRTLVEETSGGADIASWQFFGPNRVAEVVLGNGLIQTFMNNARTHSAVQSSVANPAWGNQSSDRLGYDGAGRPITKRYLNGGINGSTFAYNNTSAVVGFTTEYDQASNKLYERELHAENRSHLYEPYDANNSPTGGYDSLDRLRQYQRGTLSSTGGPGNDGGGSISSAITLPNTNESAQYDLDGLGNWRRFTTDPVGSAANTQVRQHNGLNEIARAGSTNFSYDGAVGASNGNLKDDGTLLYTWDALNRLMQVKRKSDNATIQDCVYDALNRRIRVVVSNGGLSGTIPNGTTDCLYQGWRCVEERDGSNNPTKQYVWGIYLDELIQQKNITALNNFSAGDVLYPLQDLLYRTGALADSSGTLREAYDFDAYGNTLICRNSGSPPAMIAWTNSDTQTVYPTCAFLFTGQRYDAETRNYYYKMRYYLPGVGRFGSKDPIYLRSMDASLVNSIHTDKLKSNETYNQARPFNQVTDHDYRKPQFDEELLCLNPYEYCNGLAANRVDTDGLLPDLPIFDPDCFLDSVSAIPRAVGRRIVFDCPFLYRLIEIAPRGQRVCVFCEVLCCESRGLLCRLVIEKGRAKRPPAGGNFDVAKCKCTK